MKTLSKLLLSASLALPLAWLRTGHLVFGPLPFGDSAPAYAPSSPALLASIFMAVTSASGYSSSPRPIPRAVPPVNMNGTSDPISSASAPNIARSCSSAR